jgi:hypothetical protein
MSMLPQTRARATRNTTISVLCRITVTMVTVFCMAGCVHQHPLPDSDQRPENASTTRDTGAPGPTVNPDKEPEESTPQHPGNSPSLEDARIFARQIRELGDQVLTPLSHQLNPDSSHPPVVTVLPFAPLDPARPPSMLGTYMALQLATQCVQQGFGSGENIEIDADQQENPAASYRLEGTYHVNGAALTLSARLVNQHTGTIVHATGSIVEVTPFVRGLLHDEPLQEHAVIPIREPW